MLKNILSAVTSEAVRPVNEVPFCQIWILPLMMRFRRNDEPIAMLPTRVAFCDVSIVNAVEPFVVAVTAPLEDAIDTFEVPFDMEFTADVVLPDGSTCTDLDATIVMNTFLVPAENVTADPEFEEL